MHAIRLAPGLRSTKWLFATALGLALAACGGGGPDQQTTELRAALTGEQENPPAVTGAVGLGALSLDSPSRDIRGSIVLDGLAATAAHIHAGEVGVNGPVIVPLTETAPGVWSVPPGSMLTEAQAAAFAGGGLYYNAHSTAYPGGEIRGQIGRDVSVVAVTPAQEVPPPVSTASGTGTFILDPATRRFTARLVVGGMTANAAHIHEGVPGVSGPVVFPLTQTAPGSNIWVAAQDATLTEAQLASLRAGGFYFNAHSATYPGGEIRGQIGRQVAFARLRGTEEVPPTPSTASGTGTLIVEPVTRTIAGGITLSGMTGTAAHIHLGATGANGPVIVPLTNSSGNVWSVPANTRLTAEQLLAFKQGNLYFNAHSTAFPGGEVRGQIR